MLRNRVVVAKNRPVVVFTGFSRFPGGFSPRDHRETRFEKRLDPIRAEHAAAEIGATVYTTTSPVSLTA